MIELFLESPMELQVIILSCLTIGIIQFIKDEKEKNRQKYESEKSAEAKAAKTSEKLKNFVTEFIEKNKRPPSIMEVANQTKSSTK